MMTDSIGRPAPRAYWPIPRARLTATRNFWLPLERGRQDDVRPPVGPDLDLKVQGPIGIALIREPEFQVAAGDDVEESVRAINDRPLGLAESVALEAVPAEQLRQGFRDGLVALGRDGVGSERQAGLQVSPELLPASHGRPPGHFGRVQESPGLGDRDLDGRRVKAGPSGIASIRFCRASRRVWADRRRRCASRQLPGPVLNPAVAE